MRMLDALDAKYSQCKNTLMHHLSPVSTPSFLHLSTEDMLAWGCQLVIMASQGV